METLRKYAFRVVFPDPPFGANVQARRPTTVCTSVIDEPMRRLDVPDRESLPADVRARIDEATERAGLTPNVFRAMAYRPEHFRAFFAYHDALVEATALEREEIELVVVAVSGVNDCPYCVVAHGALLRIYAEAPRLAEQVATNHRTADISETHRAMLDFAVKLTERPERVDETDFERLESHGFGRRAIWDIGSVTAFFNLSNRLAHLADMRPNDEFYRRSRPSTSGLDPEGEGRRKIEQTTVRTVDTVRTQKRRVKDLNPTLTETIWKCDSSQNPRLWRGATGVVGRGGAADPHGRTERSGVNSSRPISGRSRGIKFTCVHSSVSGRHGQNGEASGLVPEVLHGLGRNGD